MKTAFGAAFRRAAQPDKRESPNARSGPAHTGGGRLPRIRPSTLPQRSVWTSSKPDSSIFPLYQFCHPLLPAGGAGDADGLLAEGISSSSRLSCSLHFPQRTALLKILLW